MPNKIIFIFFALLVLVSCNENINDCIKNRAALDVGSGTTKVKVAKVDICKKEITEFLYEEEVPIGFKADLQAQKSGKKDMLSQEILDFGFNEIKKLHDKLKKHNLDIIVGVATSAFRTANNSIYFLSKIKSELGINIEVIDQMKEAEIGLYSAAITSKKKPEEIIAWDIGGGSMQIIAKVGEQAETYLGRIGAVSFKDQVISVIQKKNPIKVSSPNPIGIKAFKKAIELAKKEAFKNVSPGLREIIQSGRTVYGIGGVHAYSVNGQVNSKEQAYTSEDLQRIYPKRVGLNDKEIGGQYAATDITNLALVLGYMEALKIPKVNILKVNLTSGILVYPEILAK